MVSEISQIKKASPSLPPLAHSPLENRATPKDYWQLLKPRVMSLVVFTGITGLLLAPGPIHPIIALAAILCIAAGSGAAGALNMWYERDIDKLMDRTKNRPLPQGKIRPSEALGFGLTLAIGSVVVMYTLVNFWAAFYLAAAILFYVIVYTMWLKRLTPQNIVIGGAAGALPPVIGWASVMNATSWLPWILFGIIFLWTPSHFWALALYRQDDYRKARIPMLPIISGLEVTKTQILFYILALVSLTFVPLYLGEFGALYGGVAFILNGILLILGINTKLSSQPQKGTYLFTYSIVYLFFLFATMILDKFLN